ncbi:hypothetical protein U9K52_01190 [Chryseobacterium sp. MHB01]|uniref:hypothetical protein n=1 Tax=Chryseobacterium sp. MHB01 TaxID=3109433 RepID=UPI002AFE590B|nr:hypothetical protein [Chryseobacterium sp. MHB01]MEA1847513.1 hypothetical protein [Chryseobacterium sp. MHB01]
MEIKLLKSSSIITLFLFILISCQKNENWTKVLGFEGTNIQKIESYNDNADVCRMDKYSISSNDIEAFKKGYKNINAKNTFQNQSNWTSVNWDYSNLDKSIIEFVYPNFIKNDLRKIVSNKDYYYTYSYKGKKDDMFSIQLYVLVPKQKALYYFEILP